MRCEWCEAPAAAFTPGGWAICADCWDQGEDGYRPVTTGGARGSTVRA